MLVLRWEAGRSQGDWLPALGSSSSLACAGAEGCRRRSPEEWHEGLDLRNEPELPEGRDGAEEGWGAGTPCVALYGGSSEVGALRSAPSTI